MEGTGDLFLAWLVGEEAGRCYGHPGWLYVGRQAHIGVPNQRDGEEAAAGRHCSIFPAANAAGRRGARRQGPILLLHRGVGEHCKSEVKLTGLSFSCRLLQTSPTQGLALYLIFFPTALVTL